MGLSRLIPALVFAPVAWAQSFPDGPERELFEAVCSTCHEPARVLTQQMTRTQWKDKVIEMLQELPEVSEQETGKIVDYLSRNFPKRVNVNKASAKELEVALEISPKESEAILTGRTRAALKTPEEVQRAAGWTKEKLDTIRIRLEF